MAATKFRVLPPVKENPLPAYTIIAFFVAAPFHLTAQWAANDSGEITIPVIFIFQHGELFYKEPVFRFG